MPEESRLSIEYSGLKWYNIGEFMDLVIKIEGAQINA